MKKVLLFAALLTLFYVPDFSQRKSQVELIKPIIFENRNPFNLIKSFDFTSFLNDSLYKYNKKIFIPKIPDKHLFFDQHQVWKSFPPCPSGYAD